MFSKITAIAWKDTIIRFSSKSELLFFLILPIIFTVLLGGAFGGPGSDEDSRILLIVVDEDQSDLSQLLLDSLQASDAIRVETHALAEAEIAFADEEAPALLLIPSGFAER